MIEQIVNVLDKTHYIYLIGNGGSASTCSHFANDLTKYGYKAISLTDNAAIITRIANDISYEDIFKEQLKVLFAYGDVLIAISASGNSPNLLKAVEYANTLGLTIALVGFDGGQLSKMCKVVVHTPTEIGEYEKAENLHLEACHAVAVRLGEQP